MVRECAHRGGSQNRAQSQVWTPLLPRPCLLSLFPGLPPSLSASGSSSRSSPFPSTRREKPRSWSNPEPWDPQPCGQGLDPNAVHSFRLGLSGLGFSGRALTPVRHLAGRLQALLSAGVCRERRLILILAGAKPH